MTEMEAWVKIQALILERRRYCGISSSGYCSKCRSLDARWLTSMVMSGETECEECFIKRKYSEIAPQITEEDSSEIKAQRAQKVREYFRIRKCTSNVNKNLH